MEDVAESGAGAEAGPGTAPGVLSGRLSELQRLGSRDLRTEWRRLFRSDPPNLSRDLLVRAIAYRVQELAHGGLSKATARRLSSLAAGFGQDGQMSAEARPQIKPGARLIREWRGRTHVVTVTEEGFTYRDQTYPSLTRIAQEITGAHWSGPRFFGLVKRPGEPAGEKSAAVLGRTSRQQKPNVRHAASEACHGKA